MKTLARVATSQSSIKKGIFDAANLILSGKNFLIKEMFSLHVVCAGRRINSVKDDINLIKDICIKNNGNEIPNSIPKAVRSNPFKPLNGVIGSEGDRWVALNAKFPILNRKK